MQIQKTHVQQGFTIIEVLVAIMISMIFLTISMQIFVSAAFLRAQSAKYNEAYNWVQEDFEQVLSKAQQYEMSAVPYSLRCEATTYADGLAAGFLNDPTNGLNGSPVNVGPRKFGGRDFVMTRTGNYENTTDPYGLLNLNYSVTPISGGQEVLNLDLKVTMYAAFNCPN